MSDRIAVLTGLKKTGCDELDAQEWKELINYLFALCKSDINYLPMFKKLGEKDATSRFVMCHLNDGYPDESINWRNENYLIDSSAQNDPTLKALKTVKVIEVCRMLTAESQVVCVLVTDCGTVCLLRCRECSKILLITEVQVLDDNETIRYLEIFPQIGPAIILAFESMYRLTLIEKKRHLISLERRSEALSSLKSKMLFCGNITFRFPYGVSDGRTNVFPEWKPI